MSLELTPACLSLYFQLVRPGIFSSWHCAQQGPPACNARSYANAHMLCYEDFRPARGLPPGTVRSRDPGTQRKV